MNGVRILVVDDDPRINELLQDALSIEGWKTQGVLSGEEAFQWIDEDTPDLVVLDIMLPGISGIEVCRHVARVSSVPIIMLSGRTDLADKITCLNAGADDYITKPFVAEEFLAHAKAVLRRSKNGPPMSGSFDDAYLQIDFGAKVVKVQGYQVKLTHTEFHLLEELALNAGRTLGYRCLLHKLWGPEYSEEDKGCLQVHISNLRGKIEPEAKNPRYIVSLPGIGYRFQPSNNRNIPGMLKSEINNYIICFLLYFAAIYCVSDVLEII